LKPKNKQKVQEPQKEKLQDWIKVAREYCTYDQCSREGKHWVFVDNQVHKLCEMHFNYFMEVQTDRLIQYLLEEEDEISTPSK
jgi:hypothetical protein